LTNNPINVQSDVEPVEATA